MSPPQGSPDARVIIAHAQTCAVCGMELAAALARIRDRMDLEVPTFGNAK